MKNQRLLLTLLAAPLAFPTVALAVNTSPTYVASAALYVVPSGGSAPADTNACIISAPCATFQGALAKTSASGEINALTDGDFGPVLITTNDVTIDGGNHHVTIEEFGACAPLAFGATPALPAAVTAAAICVQKATGTGVFIFRNLAIKLLHQTPVVPGPDPTGPVGYGIVFGHGTSLTVENVTIDGTPSAGGNGLAYGIWTQAGTATITNARILYATTTSSSGTGILASGSAKISVNNSKLTANNFGIVVQNGATALVNNSIIAYNSVGVSTSGGATTGGILVLNANTISENTIDGLQDTGTGASIVTFNNNLMYGNTIAGFTTATVTLK